MAHSLIVNNVLNARQRYRYSERCRLIFCFVSASSEPDLRRPNGARYQHHLHATPCTFLVALLARSVCISCPPRATVHRVSVCSSVPGTATTNVFHRTTLGYVGNKIGRSRVQNWEMCTSTEFGRSCLFKKKNALLVVRIMFCVRVSDRHHDAIGCSPSSPKRRGPQPTDFRLIANIPPGRPEQISEARRPEEQHPFQPRRRLEEHFVTANVMSRKKMRL